MGRTRARHEAPRLVPLRRLDLRRSLIQATGRSTSKIKTIDSSEAMRNVGPGGQAF